MKRFCVNFISEEIEESEFGAFCLWTEAQAEINRLKEKLAEIKRNCETFRKADNMAERLCYICEEGNLVDKVLKQTHLPDDCQNPNTCGVCHVCQNQKVNCSCGK